MSNTIKIKGIILKMTDTPGKDKLLRILSPVGLISAFITPKCNAGKKSYTIDLFTYGEIVLFKTDSGNFLVNSVNPEEYFYSLREDIARLAAASYFSSLVLNSANEPDIDYNWLLELLLHSFTLLSNGEDVLRIKPVFEMKFTQAIGVEPCLEAEQKSGSYFFDIEDGRLYLHDINHGIYVSRNTVMSVYIMLKSSIADAFEYTCEEMDKLNHLTESYIVYHTERSFDSLEFLKGVI